MTVSDTPFETLFRTSPFLADFFKSQNLPPPELSRTPDRYFAGLSADTLSVLGLDARELADRFERFAAQLEDLARRDAPLQRLEILGGRDKRGIPEGVRSLALSPGDLLAIVGPTGAGKSRLLEDIECLAQGDTPTGRHIRINGRAPAEEERFGGDTRLVAQLSQNMNFVVDLCVADFLTLHAESRLVEDPHHVVAQVLQIANELAGEPFAPETPVTALSGGQSRALMIADTACLSRSPIVLVDEIENAGIDRDRALEWLVRQEKIVLLVTHDPELALSAPRRLVVREGGMAALVIRSEAENGVHAQLKTWSRVQRHLRNEMRAGHELAL